MDGVVAWSCFIMFEHDFTRTLTTFPHSLVCFQKGKWKGLFCLCSVLQHHTCFCDATVLLFKESFARVSNTNKKPSISQADRNQSPQTSRMVIFSFFKCIAFTLRCSITPLSLSVVFYANYIYFQHTLKSKKLTSRKMAWNVDCRWLLFLSVLSSTQASNHILYLMSDAKNSVICFWNLPAHVTFESQFLALIEHHVLCVRCEWATL